MITPSLIYLINLADGIQAFILYIFIASIGLITVILWAAYQEHSELCDWDKKRYPEEYERNQKHLRTRNKLIKSSIITFSLSAFLILLGGLLPTTKTCYEMLILPKIANAQLTQKLPIYLQEYIEKELKGDDK